MTTSFSNKAPEDHEPTDFRKAFEDEFGGRRVVRPIVDHLLSWLGVQLPDEDAWEDGLRGTLDEMTDEGLLILYDRRLQIEIRDHDCSLALAYFPIHRHRWLAAYVDLKPTTQVLLVISATRVENRSTAAFQKKLRRQIGHVLRYLQHPTWPNKCYHAAKEWKKWSEGSRNQCGRGNVN